MEALELSESTQFIRGSKGINHWLKTFLIYDNNKELGILEKSGEVWRDLIEQEATKYFNLTKEDIFRKTRKMDVVKCRQIIYWLLCKKTTYSISKIGSFYGKDHSTVIHSRNKIRDLIDSGDKFGKMAQEIEFRIKLRNE